MHWYVGVKYIWPNVPMSAMPEVPSNTIMFQIIRGIFEAKLSRIRSMYLFEGEPDQVIKYRGGVLARLAQGFPEISPRSGGHLIRWSNA